MSEYNEHPRKKVPCSLKILFVVFRHIRYEGDFKNNLRVGKGIIYYKDGSKYEGEFKNNVRDGKGIIYFCNRDFFRRGIY